LVWNRRNAEKSMLFIEKINLLKWFLFYLIFTFTHQLIVSRQIDMF